MTDTPAKPDPSRDNGFPAGQDTAALLRAAADDQLTPEQAAALERHLADHPEDRARIESERALRRAVAAAMDTGPAPAALRQSIEAMLRQDRTTSSQATDTVGPAETRSRSFWRRTVLPVAIAAMVLLSFGVFLSQRNGQGPALNGGFDAGALANAVSFVEQEHRKCADSPEYRRLKLTVTEAADVAPATQRQLGAAPQRIQLDDQGYTFAGYGPCHVPGSGASGQLVYMPTSGRGAPISLFIQRDKGHLDNLVNTSDCVRDAIKANRAGRPGEPQPEDQVYIWRANGLIYYLITDRDNEAAPCLESLGAPAHQVSL
ncbi:MAG: hypothetical protein H6813_04590 [Phycisphaeraceae bacterium]|nr:hypothetical protein [Phycisphaeraceae bacterium]MCB9847227.1 hypothetical protein [Phycisphaeraceae bacterium]